jgi:hypothetical protein
MGSARLIHHLTAHGFSVDKFSVVSNRATAFGNGRRRRMIAGGPAARDLLSLRQAPPPKGAVGVFIDHGTEVVIGETAVVGDHCVIFHNVTLGGTGKYHGERQPIVEDRVFIGTNALLGPIRVGHHAKVGANAFVINRDVPAHSAVPVELEV